MNLKFPYILYGLCVLILGWVGFQKVKAQPLEPAFIHFGLADGLPALGNYDAFTDEKGRIWVATNAGLVCHDGHEFKVYTRADGLPENRLLKITEDQSGRIWGVGLLNEFAYLQDGKFHPYPFNQVLKDSLTTRKHVLNFVVQDGGDLYISYESGAALVKVDTSGKFNKIGNTPVKQSLIRLLETDSKLLVQVKEDINFWKKDPNFKLENHFLFGSTSASSHSLLSASKSHLNKLPRMEQAIQLQDGRLLINTRRGLFCQMEPDGEIVALRKDRAGIFLFQDSEGWIYEGTISKGVYVYHPSQLEEPMFHWLKKEGVSAVAEDPEKGLWFATRNNGLFYSPNKRFLHLERRLPNRPKRVGYDRWGTRYECYPNQNEVWQLKAGQRKAIGSLKGGGPSFFTLPPDHSFLALVDREGIRAYDPKSGRIQKAFSSPPRVILRGRAYSDSLIIIAASNNIVSINHEGSVEKRKLPIPIQCGVANSRGDWFIGNKAGLYLLPKDTSPTPAVKVFPLDTSEQIGVFDLEGNGDTLFFATNGQGVWVRTPDSIFKIISGTNLPLEFVLGVTMVDPEQIFIGTREGLVLVRPFETQKVKAVFHLKNGLKDLSLAHAWLRDDTLVFSGVEYTGVLALKDLPQEISPLLPPPLESYQGSHLVTLDQTHFPPDGNEFIFEFKNYAFQNDVQYKYQLIGWDSHWNETEENEIRYGNLPPGAYEFKVESRTKYGYWSQNFSSQTFEILPPFWYTWWFITLMLLAGAGVISLLTHWRVLRVKRKLEWEKRLISLKNDALRAQMNPHFTFNAMNAIQSFITGNEKRKAADYLASFAKMIRMILELSRQDSVSLEKEISFLKQYLELEMMRFPGQIEWSIEEDSDLEVALIFIPSLMIQPLVENAILHGLSSGNRKGNLRIRLTKKGPDMVQCVVWDNGVGSKEKNPTLQTGPTLEKRSIGLQILHERLESLHQSGLPKGTAQLLWDHEIIPWGKGTTAIIVLPILEEDV